MVSFPWRWLSAVKRTLIELFRSSITAPPQRRVPRHAWCLRLHLRYTHAQNKQTKKKKRHKYTTGKLSDWSVKSLNSCRREKKPRNIEEAMESGAEQQPLYTVLPEKLIQPPTISSKEDSFRSVTYSKNDNAFYPSSGSVLSVRRLPPAKKRKKTWVELSNSRFALRKLYHRATGNSNWFKWQPFHLLLWILNPNIIIHVHSPYSSLHVSFSTDKENSFNNQSFLGWRSFRLFSWS